MGNVSQSTYLKMKTFYQLPWLVQLIFTSHFTKNLQTKSNRDKMFVTQQKKMLNLRVILYLNYDNIHLMEWIGCYFFS